MLPVLRSIVSKNKRRYRQNGFDLDLTYITDRVIAMAAPGESYEKLYRNNFGDVQRCSERSYDENKFHGRVSRYGFDDHQVPPFNMIPLCILDITTWLNANPENVAVIHCKAGKGRTGMMVSCLLLRLHIAPDARKAIAYFDQQRTTDSQGVTIPSQHRYVEYYERLVRGYEVGSRPKMLYRILLYRCPFPEPVVRVIRELTTVLDSQYDRSAVKVTKRGDSTIIATAVRLDGDVKIEVHNGAARSSDPAFCAWFHTAFVFKSTLAFKKSDLDRACKDTNHRRFSADLALELLFHDSSSADATSLPGGEDEDLFEDQLLRSTGFGRCSPEPLNFLAWSDSLRPPSPTAAAKCNTPSPKSPASPSVQNRSQSLRSSLAIQRRSVDRSFVSNKENVASPSIRPHSSPAGISSAPAVQMIHMERPPVDRKSLQRKDERAVRKGWMTAAGSQYQQR
mmetsp:Transcript_3226/g.5738  ORF Transcript_3226/g.5738 Transcript_3226/m.5738 type:complete len:452 (-) Transcript_3226:235-1590(-)